MMTFVLVYHNNVYSESGFSSLDCSFTHSAKYNASRHIHCYFINVLHSLLLYCCIFFLQRVIEVSKKYLPFMSTGFSDPRVKVHIEDGSEFLCQNKDRFDVIITDSSDPIGNYVGGWSHL